MATGALHLTSKEQPAPCKRILRDFIDQTAGRNRHGSEEVCNDEPA